MNMVTTFDTGMMSPGRAAGAYLTETRYEFMRVIRNPVIGLPIVFIPVALYWLISVVVFGEAIAKDPDTGVYLFAGFAVLGVTMPALFTVGGSLAMEREMGLLRLKRAQPAPAGTWLVAKIACGIAFSVLAYLPLLAVALSAGKISLGTGRIVAMSLVLILGSIPFCALGLMIGAMVKGSAAPGFANLVYLPGCYLGGLFFRLPEWMNWQLPIWPQFYLDQLAMHAAGVARFQYITVQIAIAGLVGFTVLFSVVAIWRLARKG